MSENRQLSGSVGRHRTAEAMIADRTLLLFCLKMPSLMSTAAAQSDPPRTKDKFTIDDLPSEDRKKTETPPSGDACQATIDENSGIVTMTLSDPTRAGEQTAIMVDRFGDNLPLTYPVRFGDKGDLSLEAPIFHENALISWTGWIGRSLRTIDPVHPVRSDLSQRFDLVRFREFGTACR